VHLHNRTHDPGVRRLARGWLADLDTLVDRYVPQVCQIAEYRDRSVPPESVREYAGPSIALVLHLIAREPPPDELTQISASVGQDRARRGVELEGLVDALQLNFRIVWEALLERAGPTDSAEMLQCGPLIWEAVGTHLTRAVSGYKETVAEMARERQDSRRAAFAALVDSGGQDPATLAEVAAALSLDVAARFGVVVAAPAAEQELGGIAARLRTRAVPVYHQESPVGDVLVVQLPAKLRDVPGTWLGNTACAVGPIASGLAEVPGAFGLATRMTRLRRPGQGGPLRLRDAWLTLIAHESAAIIPYLVSDVLGPLSADEDGEPENIIKTVRVFLAGEGSVGSTAARLYCHRNTVVNRLRRFCDITGLDVRRPADAAVVLVALRAPACGGPEAQR
jgi:hypothetical protein